MRQPEDSPKKSFRVFVRDPVGDRQEWWELSPSEAKGSLDEQGNAYGIRYYEQGKPVDHVVPKSVWERLGHEYDRIAEAAGTPEESPESKTRGSDLAELRNRFLGKPFHLLVETHMKRVRGWGNGAKKKNLRTAMLGTVGLLPTGAQQIASGFIDRWNDPANVYSSQFWQSDSANVFEAILADGRAQLASAGMSAEDETLFNLFQIVIINYAYNALDQPTMRKFIVTPRQI